MIRHNHVWINREECHASVQILESFLNVLNHCNYFPCTPSVVFHSERSSLLLSWKTETYKIFTCFHHGCHWRVSVWFFSTSSSVFSAALAIYAFCLLILFLMFVHCQQIVVVVVVVGGGGGGAVS